VNGRYPPPLLGADWGMPRCDCTLPEAVFLEPMFSEPMRREPMLEEPIFVRSEFAELDERVLLLGAVNGRDSPRFPFCIDDCWPAFRFAELFLSLPPNVPALGFCMVPRTAADWPPLARPPAGIAPT